MLIILFKGYEDILRHKSDREINNLPVSILRDGKFKKQKWKDVKVGDIVEVNTDQSFPCDLLLLHSFTENNDCHITTANLDGERNLKVVFYILEYLFLYSKLVANFE